MLPDRVSNPGPLTYESGALPIALRGPALTQLFFILVALVDNMRLYGIQTPDPIALVGFSGITRPLNIMCYVAKGGMAVKVMVL